MSLNGLPRSVVSALLAVGVVAVSVLVAAAPAAAAAAADPSGVSAVVQGLNVAVSWSDGAATGVSGYVVSTAPASPSVTVPAGASSAVLTGVRPGVPYTVSVAAQTSAGTGTPVPAVGTVQTVAPGGSFHAVSPARLLDTRHGVGAPVGPTSSVVLQVTGRGGLPASAVGSVAVNLTVLAPQASGYVTGYADGGARPTVANVNYSTGHTVGRLAVLPVGADGRVVLFSSAKTQLVADVAGYYTTTAAASPSAGLFHPVAPARIMDTRSGLGGSALGAGKTVNLPVTGAGGVPASGVSAVVVNTTVLRPSAYGYLTAYPAGQARPLAASLNFASNHTVANRVVVPVGAGGQVSLFNSAGTTPLVVDVTGWYTDGSDTSAGGSYYQAVTPTRLVDTRIGQGAPKATVAAGGVLPVTVAGTHTIPAATSSVPATAAAVTVTMLGASAVTYVTVYPSLGARPTAADLVTGPGVAVGDLALAGLGVDGDIDVFNHAGTANVVVDLSGYFIGGVHTPSSTITPPASAVTEVTGTPGGNQTVTLAAGTATPTIGQIVSSAPSAAAPDGLLVQVTDTATNGAGQTVVDTQPATLQQAVGDATIDLSTPLSAADVVSTRTADGRIHRTGRTGTVRVPQLQQRAVNPSAAEPVTGHEKEPCTGDAGSFVDVTHEFTPTLNLDVQLGHHGFTPTVTANAGAHMHEQLAATVGYGARVTCTWNTTLLTYKFRAITVDVAGVPVVIFPVLTVSLAASLSGQATVSASVSQTFDADAGLRYDGKTVTPYSDLTNTIAHTGPTFTAANATAKVALSADLEGKLYNVTGPDVTITGTLTGTANVTATPWWTLKFALTAVAGFHFQKLFVHVDISTPTITLYNATLAQAAGGTTTAPPVIITTSLPTATIGTPYSTQLTTADHRTGTWTITNGTLPAGLTLTGYTITGTPKGPAATSTFSINFADATGKTATAATGITVTGSSSGGGPAVTVDPAAVSAWNIQGCSFVTPSFPVSFGWQATGYKPNEGLSPSVGGLNWIGDFITDGNGAYSDDFEIGSYPAGNYDFSVLGDSGDSASTPLGVGISWCFHYHYGATITVLQWAGAGEASGSSETFTLTGATSASSTADADDLGSYAGGSVTVDCGSDGTFAFDIAGSDGSDYYDTLPCYEANNKAAQRAGHTAVAVGRANP